MQRALHTDKKPAIPKEPHNVHIAVLVVLAGFVVFARMAFAMLVVFVVFVVFVRMAFAVRALYAGHIVFAVRDPPVFRRLSAVHR